MARAIDVHPSVELRVLHEFEIRLDGRTVEVSAGVERLLAYLALQDRPQHRQTVAARLWTDVGEERAAANLRAAIWRGRRVLDRWIVVAGNHLALASDVDVDLHRLVARAHRLLQSDAELDEHDREPTDLLGDLLPTWDEDWIVFERERIRQLRVHALEVLSDHLRRAGRSGQAVDVALMAMSVEPLRESAQRLLAAAHVAEGNVSEARRQFERYRVLLEHELGIEPSDELRAIVGLPAVRAAVTA